MTPSGSRLAEMILGSHDALLLIKRRWYVLERAEAELSECTRGKPYRIQNDIAFRMLLDTHDMLVIDLASFATDMLETGGLIGQLRARINELPRRRRGTSDDEDLEQILSGHHAAAFSRLFGSSLNARGTGPSGQAVDQLRDRFDEQVRAVVDDRNRNRAHRFERLSTAETAAILGVGELGDRFTFLERFLNDLLLLAGSATYSHREMNATPAADAVPPIIDLILLGEQPDDRTTTYERLHTAVPVDEPRVEGAPEVLFNEYGRIRQALVR